jgi:single-stranded-DNA-specific exonuclease
MNESLNLPVTQWLFTAGDQNTLDLLSHDLGIHPIVSQILVSRDIKDPDNARKYLRPSLNDLPNPFLMKIGKRRPAGYQSHPAKGKHLNLRDYDADGITAVVVLMKFLRGLTPHVSYYIPDRIEEGYGLNRPAIDRMQSDRVQLIITGIAVSPISRRWPTPVPAGWIRSFGSS